MITNPWRLCHTVLNKESRRDWCLEDDLLSSEYPFLDPRFLPLADSDLRIPLLRICLAQMNMALKVMLFDFQKAQRVSARCRALIAFVEHHRRPSRESPQLTYYRCLGRILIRALLTRHRSARSSM
jgi:hypothetical protein